MFPGLFSFCWVGLSSVDFLAICLVLIHFHFGHFRFGLIWNFLLFYGKSWVLFPLRKVWLFSPLGFLRQFFLMLSISDLLASYFIEFWFFLGLGKVVWLFPGYRDFLYWEFPRLFSLCWVGLFSADFFIIYLMLIWFHFGIFRFGLILVFFRFWGKSWWVFPWGKVWLVFPFHDFFFFADFFSNYLVLIRFHFGIFGFGLILVFPRFEGNSWSVSP